jgi:long-chain acyl-CoA synthetase
LPTRVDGEALMTVVEPQPGVMLDVAGIRAQLKTSLAGYQVPRDIEIQAQLPREDSGKIFKRRLRDPYWQRAGRRI